MVVVTFKFCNPLTSTLRAEVLTVTPGVLDTAGAAETATTEATRATREARSEEENILVKVV